MKQNVPKNFAFTWTRKITQKAGQSCKQKMVLNFIEAGNEHLPQKRPIRKVFLSASVYKEINNAKNTHV